MKKTAAVVALIAGILCLVGPYIYEYISILIEIQKPGVMLCSPVWLAAWTEVIYDPLWIVLAVAGVILIVCGWVSLGRNKEQR